MIFKIREGQLGNQLFQYVAIRAFAFPEEKIVLVGFDSLFKLFDGINATNIRAGIGVNFLHTFYSFINKKLFYWQSSNNFFGKIVVDVSNNLIPKRIKSGIITLVEPDSYFSSEEACFPASSNLGIDGLRIKEHWENKAKEILRQYANGCSPVFVHVRRGDYLLWPSKEEPAAVDAEWFLRAMAQIRKTVINPKFLIFTDDKEYCETAFGSENDIWISDQSFEVDFALMTLSEAGILSPSTFSWWATRLNTNRNSGNFVCPYYWAGFNSKKWYPNDVRTSFLRYLK